MSFGPEFAALLRKQTLAAPLDILTIFAYESRLDPMCINSHGYSGLWQNAPTNGVPYVKLPYKHIPSVQLKDYLNRTYALAKQARLTSPVGLGPLYCLNLAPARAGCEVVYADPLRPYAGLHAEEYYACARRWPKAYKAQDRKLDPEKKGYIAQAGLLPPLLAARRVLQKRIDEVLRGL